MRPLNLQGIARETLARYAGRLPDDADALRSMRGIGRYTAGAILSFAYRQDAALVDTNVRRVLGRVFLGPRRIRRLRGDKVIWALAEALVPPEEGLRLQPGPHGLRRDLVHGPRSPLPALPNEALLRHLSNAPEEDRPPPLTQTFRHGKRAVFADTRAVTGRVARRGAGGGVLRPSLPG